MAKMAAAFQPKHQPKQEGPMGQWILTKITIEAELDGVVKKLELKGKALTKKYIGLGWGNIRKKGIYENFHIFDPRIFNGVAPTATKSTPPPPPPPVMSRPSGDQPALLLKEPNCCVDLWP